MDENAVGDHDVTILTRGESSRWYWMNDIEVSHIYISQGFMEKVANEVFNKDIERVFVDHFPIVNDPALSKLMATYEAESLSDEPGSALYAQALAVQMCIHLIRQYVRCDVRNVATPRLSNTKLDVLQAFIDAHLSSPITVKDMATVVDLSPSYFVRLFGTVYGVSPHQYVQSRRLARAKKLLTTLRDVPLKAIAVDCGFSDQSHMTRLFKEKLSVTPMQFRRTGTSPLLNPESLQ